MLTAENLLAFDMMKVGEQISTITLGTASQVYVIDILSLGAIKTVASLMKTLFDNEDLRIVAYSFARDAYFLCREIFYDPSNIKNVVELTQMNTDSDGKRIELSKMVETVHEKPLSQFLRRFNWLNRPLGQELVDFSVLNVAVKIGIYDQLAAAEGFEVPTYQYVEPKIQEKKPREQKAPRNQRRGSRRAPRDPRRSNTRGRNR